MFIIETVPLFSSKYIIYVNVSLRVEFLSEHHYTLSLDPFHTSSTFDYKQLNRWEQEYRIVIDTIVYP